MDLAELRKRKKEFEEEITDCIDRFMAETDVSVKSIEFQLSRCSLGDDGPRWYALHVKSRLEAI